MNLLWAYAHSIFFFVASRHFAASRRSARLIGLLENLNILPLRAKC